MNGMTQFSGKVEREEYFNPVSLPLRIVVTRPSNGPLHPVHEHDFTELGIVISGRAMHLTAAGRDPVAPGDVLLVPWGASHGYADMEDFVLINLLFVQRRLPLPLLDFGIGPLAGKLFAPGRDGTACRAEKLMSLPPDTLHAVLDLTHRITGEDSARRSSSLFLIMALFMEILVLLDRAYSPGRPSAELETIPRALEFLENNYRSAVDFNLLAKRLGMSRRSFFRHFRAAAGTSPLQYLHNIRLRHAALMLRQTAHSIDRIALESGYQDRSVFARHFRKIYLCSPLSYRREK